MRATTAVALLVIICALQPAAVPAAAAADRTLDLLQKGQTLARQGRPAEAAQAYNEFIESLLAGKPSGAESVLLLCYASAFLGDLYVWHLDRGQDALTVYRDGLAAIAATDPDPSGRPTDELLVQAAQGWMHLLTAEALAHLKRTAEADAAYERSLAALRKLSQARATQDFGPFLREAVALVEHQRRVATLRAGQPLAAAVQRALLKLPNPARKAGMGLIAAGMAALAEKGLGGPEADLAAWIRTSPRSLGAMGMNATLIREAGATNVHPGVEKALRAYLDRYPDSYYVPDLLYEFYEYYQLEERPKDAARVLAELKRYAAGNRYTLALGADKRYATPEATWRTYVEALARGDAEAALDCVAPSKQAQQREIFAALGPAGMRKAAQTTGKIRAVREMGHAAEYAVTRPRGDTTQLFLIYFAKVAGEWKIQEM